MTIFGQDETRPPVLIVHGLFGSARNWRVIAKRMAEARRVITVDMRNHGTSFQAPSHNYHDLAGDLAGLIENLGRPVDLVGHSMGGKAAMVLALSDPQLVRRLLVADIAPVSYDHSQSHLIEAMRNLDLSGKVTRTEADALLARDIDTPELRAFLLQSFDVQNQRWRLNLDTLERDMALITGFPQITGQFDGPTLMLSGATSDYVRPDYRPGIKSLFPAVKYAKIPGAGHWLHAEKPREFIAAAQVFLSA